MSVFVMCIQSFISKSVVVDLKSLEPFYVHIYVPEREKERERKRMRETRRETTEKRGTHVSVPACPCWTYKA